MAEKTINNSTIARIAGNIASTAFSMADLHTIGQGGQSDRVNHELVSAGAVIVARAIALEVERTTPKPDENEPF